MTQEASRLLAQALLLSEQERGEFAARLIESLDADSDADVEAAWAEEIKERLDSIDKGTVQMLPWAEARKLILEDTDESPQP
jgi:putative addiction module component (TIGR02574 family)